MGFLGMYIMNASAPVKAIILSSRAIQVPATKKASIAVDTVKITVHTFLSLKWSTLLPEDEEGEGGPSPALQVAHPQGLGMIPKPVLLCPREADTPARTQSGGLTRIPQMPRLSRQSW